MTGARKPAVLMHRLWLSGERYRATSAPPPELARDERRTHHHVRPGGSGHVEARKEQQDGGREQVKPHPVQCPVARQRGQEIESGRQRRRLPLS